MIWRLFCPSFGMSSQKINVTNQLDDSSLPQCMKAFSNLPAGNYFQRFFLIPNGPICVRLPAYLWLSEPGIN